MHLLQIECSAELFTAIEARQIVTGAKSRRSCARALLEVALAHELGQIKETQLTLSDPDKPAGPSQAVMTHQNIREIADKECRETAERDRSALSDLRLWPKEWIQLKMVELQEDSRLPANIPFRPFVTGWRQGVHNDVYTHGTYNGYSKGCRCETCRNAWKLYKRDLRTRKVKRMREQLAKIK